MTLVSDMRHRFAAEPAFTSRDVRAFFGRRRMSPGYQKLMVHKLISQGKLFRISKGAYTFMQEAQAVGFAFQPFYYGLQDALSLRNLWEQETVPVVVTPRRVRSGIRKFAGSNYLVRRIRRSMFFGFEMLRYGDFWIPVSDVEKTLIDLVYFRQPVSRGLAGELKRAIRKDVLKRYLKRSPLRVRKRVLALLAE